MSRRLPSSLAHQLKCCKLFTTGQRCATCPSKGSNPCPLPDIEDCLLPRQLAAQASRVQSQLRIECEVPRDDVQKPIGLSAVVKSEREARSKEVKLLRPKPLSPAAGCMRLLASVPSASPPSRGMKIVSPQEAPSMSVGLGVPADQPLVSADPFEVFRALRKAAEQRSATSVTLSSSEGKALFQEAMAVGSMENYFDLAQNHITQGTEGAGTTFLSTHPAAPCPVLTSRIALPDNSLSCMAMILNALGHDPKHTWKGMWRWNTPEVLQREDPNAESTKVDVVDFAAKVASSFRPCCPLSCPHTLSAAARLAAKAQTPTRSRAAAWRRSQGSSSSGASSKQRAKTQPPPPTSSCTSTAQPSAWPDMGTSRRSEATTQRKTWC